VSGARRFDDLEQLSGVARVLRIELQHGERVRELVQALAQLPHVEAAVPERMVFSPLDAGHQTTLLRVDMEEAWRARELIRLPQALAYETGDDTVLIGLADTGVLSDYPAFARSVRPGFDTVDLNPKALAGMQLIGDGNKPDSDPNDEVGHGTGCAGILCGDTSELPPGAAGRCSMIPARVLGAALRGERRVGVGSVANIDAGMKRLIDLGSKVINMSFGTPLSQLVEGEPLPHIEVIRYALARGVILVAASGNSGLTEPYYPAAHTGVIAVGAVNSIGLPARFATRGEHVAMCAPGEGIWTCGLQGMQRASGTSFAAPFVSAACALLVARAQARAWPLEPEQAKQILMQSTRAFGCAGVDGLGTGVLDVYAALRALDDWIDNHDDYTEAVPSLSQTQKGSEPS
jgi:subtilisin family serine protease